MDRREKRTLAAVNSCAGFEAGTTAQMEGRMPVSCARMPMPDGRYRLRVRIEADQDTPQALLFGNHRRLLWRGSLKAGEHIEIDAAGLLAPYLPDGADEAKPCDGIELALAASGARIKSAQAEQAGLPAVLLLGDSTVTDQGALSPYAPGATYCGWGQMLPFFLGGEACVGNYARSGMTAETFRAEGLYDLLRAQVRPGDLALIQFGHNDQKRAHLTAQGGFADAIRTYIRELRALGARPVLVTPLARNSWWNEREYNDLLASFAQSLTHIGREMDAPVIDLHAFMMELLQKTGRDAAKPLFHTGDYTHTNDFGAYAAARFVAGELKRMGLADTRRADCWPPHGPHDVPANNQGDESLPPQGLEALYIAYETIRPDATLTRIEALELVNRTCALFSCNEYLPMPADAALGEAYTSDVQCALQARLIPEDMMADGKLHRRREISAEDFMRILVRGYGMRCRTDSLPGDKRGKITRAEAAALCRMAKI